MKNIVILISGSGTNMESLITKSRSQGLDVRFTVICDNPSAGGISKAKKLGVETIDVNRFSRSPRMNSEDEGILMELLTGIKPDFILLAGFMRIISKGIIVHYKNRIVNIHPSLLPSFKGRDAQKQAFDYGVKVSGCTVHFIDSGVDTGPVIMQECVDISGLMSHEEVRKKILRSEHSLYFKALKLLISGNYTVKDRRVLIDD